MSIPRFPKIDLLHKVWPDQVPVLLVGALCTLREAQSEMPRNKVPVPAAGDTVLVVSQLHQGCPWSSE